MGAGVSGQKWCDNNNVSAGAKGFWADATYGFQEAAWDGLWKRCTRCHMPTTVTAAVVLLHEAVHVRLVSGHSKAAPPPHPSSPPCNETCCFLIPYWFYLPPQMPSSFYTCFLPLILYSSIFSSSSHSFSPSSSFLSLDPPPPPPLLLNSDRLFISFCLAASPPTPLTRFALLFLHVCAHSYSAWTCVRTCVATNWCDWVLVGVCMVLWVCFCLYVFPPHGLCMIV